MKFATPTTLDELYEILNEIYNYYRLQPEIYTASDLVPLNITRMTFTPLSDEQLMSKAEENLASAQQIRLMNYVDGLTEKLNDIKAKVKAAEVAKNEELASNEQTFSSAKDVIAKRAIKTNTTDSGVYTEKLFLLEKERGKKAAEINAEYAANVYELSQKEEELTSLINSAENKFSDICASEVVAEYNKLKTEQDKTLQEVFKYNNSLDEKEQRFENSRKRHVNEMQLRHMEIRLQGYSKDELVQRGYYNDVIKCVTDYFNTMTPEQAFKTVKEQPKLAIYLDDYYSNIVYFYKARVD